MTEIAIKLISGLYRYHGKRMRYSRLMNAARGRHVRLLRIIVAGSCVLEHVEIM